MKAIRYLLLILAAMLMFSACSEISSPVGPSNEHTTDSYIYPPVEDVIANLPAGFRVVNTLASALDDECDSLIAERTVRPTSGSNLNGDAVKLYVGAGAVPETVTLTVVSSNTCIAVADFYPHPYQFNQNVEIRWDLDALELPQGTLPTDLVPWYVTDAGELVQVQWSLSEDERYLSIWTNHFSRYIISARIY